MSGSKASGETAGSVSSGARSWLPVGLGMHRLGHLCLKAPRVSLVVLILAIAIGAFGVSRMGFDNDLRNLYRTDSAQSRLLDEMLSRFPALQNQIVLLVEGERLGTRNGMETLRNLHLDLEFVDGLAGSISPFSARRPPVGDAAPEPLFPADLPEGKILQALIEEAKAHPLLGSKVLSRDGNSALITLFVAGDASPSSVARAVLNSVDETLGFGNPADLTVVATGGPIIREEILSGVKRDQVVLNGLGTLVALILCTLIFRRLRLVIIATLPGMVGVSWTLGAFGLIGHPLNAMTNVLPTLVLVIAFADALHMINAARTRMRQTSDALDAARHAVAAVGPACAMTSITTSVVFLALSLSASPTIRDFGYAGAWAALMAFTAVITVVPTLCALMLRPADAGENSANTAPQRLFARIAAAAATLATTRPAMVAIAGLALMALATAGYIAVDTRYSYRDFLPDGSVSSGVIDRIDARLGGADTVNIMIRREGEAGGPPDEVLYAVHDIVAGMEAFASVFSIKSVEDWLGRRLSAGESAAVDDALILPDHLVGQLGSADGDAWLVTAYMSEMDSRRSAPLLDRLDTALDPVRSALPGFRIDVTGVVPMTDRSSNDLIRSLNVSLVAAIAVTIAFIALTFRSLRLGALAAVPNYLPLAAAGSVLYLTGDGLQITSVVALTVAFGIAVDDTIHLLHQWSKERGGSEAERLRAALNRVGPVLIATTCVLTAGFATTAASTMQIVRAFGTICVLTICVALIADLLLLPALILLADRFRKPRETEHVA